MGSAGREALEPPAPVDADIAADRVKIFEAKLGFRTDAFTSTDFKGAVFLGLGDPTDLFLLSRSALNSLKSAVGKPKVGPPRNDAIVIATSAGGSYSDILKKVKAEPQLKELGQAVQAVRRTAK